MKIGITGHSGQLGRELVKLGGIRLKGRLMSDQMLTDIEDYKPDAIINCAALTNVDYCEGKPLEAAATNAEGVAFLSRVFSGYLVQISTDYVFDGLNGPYGVRDAPNPISIYGWSKHGGELMAKAHKGPSLIIRTTVLFSDTRNNFVSKVVDQLESGNTVTMYNPELVGTPTYVPALSKEVWRIVNEGYTGLAHIAGNKRLSRLNFARMVADVFGYDQGLVEPNYGPLEGAPRPQRAGLICDHSEYKSIKSHNITDGLMAMAFNRTKGATG